MRYHYSMDFQRRFWSKVAIGEPDECWEWTGARSSNRYGVFQVRTRVAEGAHRIAWTLSNATDPSGDPVLHHCDNPPCCNPAHLYRGSALENMADKVRRGRHVSRPPRGTAHRDAKLTEADILEIRRRYAAEGRGGRPGAGNGDFRPTGRLTMRALAREYGVDHTQILRAIRGEQWSHV